MAPRVTIAVVSWNTRELLRRCLASMAEDVAADRAEVWVVDNCSSDGSAEMVTSEFGWAELIASEENLGFGPAVNLVAERTDTPWLAIANADTELREGALETLLDAGDRDREAAVLAPRLVRPDGATQHSVHRFPSPKLALAFGLGLHRLSRRLGDSLLIEGSWNPDRERWVDWAHGAFLLSRREAFEAIGGFDPGQWMYAEDLDFCWRLRRAGFGVRYLPEASVRHEVAASTRQAFGNDLERAGRHVAASYEWMAKRRGPGIARITAATNMLFAAIRVGLLAPLALVAPSRFAEPLGLNRRYVGFHGQGLRRPRGGPAAAD